MLEFRLGPGVIVGAVVGVSVVVSVGDGVTIGAGAAVTPMAVAADFS